MCSAVELSIRGVRRPYFRLRTRSETPLESPAEPAGPIVEVGQPITISNTIGNIRVHSNGQNVAYWTLGYATTSGSLDWLPATEGFRHPVLRATHCLSLRSPQAPRWVTLETAKAYKCPSKSKKRMY